ncbi:MAG TPA: choline dehydrogenase, partial [Candidatus Limnocylindrales bacterium]|nr:choline dehydrogenase [Candidatus Limnocylindrales bacterium]
LEVRVGARAVHGRAARWDVVIVGGGSAGCVLANRLTEDPARRVLVLEAGRPDWRLDPFIHMPAALTFPIGSRFYDWKYESEPEPFMNGRRIAHARGRVLGGSSSINGMIFQRGNPLDFERWAADPGMETWSYAHCLPYFRRMEDCTAAVPDDPFRGKGGPLTLERGPATSPLFQAWFEAAEQAGYERTADVNGYRQEGVAAFDRNIRKSRRWSAADAYLRPARQRPNLEVRTSTFVGRVLVQDQRAVGVEVLRRNRGKDYPEHILAGEVILCGGAINTPQLLMLSGIGPADHLRDHGILIAHDLPGVGEHLQDHLEVYVQHAATKPVSMQPAATQKWRRPFIGAQWLFLRSGPGASNHFEAGGFVRGDDQVAYPNLMFHFLPIAIRYDGTPATNGHGYQVHVGPMYSDARGSIRLKSADPRAHPALRFNYLSTDQDRREWVDAIRVARHILGQPAFKAYDGGELSPGGSVASDEEILAWVKRDAETALHPSCTARMGTDAMSVVDPLTMGVHGVDALRVVDASAMPYITNGNIYAPVMMLAEKAADLIVGRMPLPAEHVPFYRHRAADPEPD